MIRKRPALGLDPRVESGIPKKISSTKRLTVAQPAIAYLRRGFLPLFGFN